MGKRGANCADVGEYDSGFPGQSGSRDGEVAASGNDCGSPPRPGPRWASTAFASSEYSDTGWSALQATGPPDTSGCGDFSTAWAPLDSGTGPEWLEVGYDTPVMATGVNVYETNIGSFIYQVDVRLQSGSLETVWTGTDGTPCFGVFHATWPAPADLVTGLRIHTQVAGWEEIDAVELLVDSPPETTVSAFTGADPGEGLDFAGTFVYAVNVRGPGGFSVGDAVFTDDSAPGVTWAAQGDILDWTTPEYGDTADDDNLEVVMQSIRWSPVPEVVTYTLGGLTPGERYKLQLLFCEGCCERGFDVFVDGMLVVDEFAPYQVHGGINPSGSGAVVTHTFNAQSTSVEIVLDGNDATFPDRNPMLDGLTLELVGGGP